jgi:hypothetical protein
MKRQKLTILSIISLLFVAGANAYIPSELANNIFWTGAGDGVSWLDINNWYEEPHWSQESRTLNQNYGIPGWWIDNPYDVYYTWNVNSNKGYAVFNGGGTVTINNLPDGRIERLFVGGATNTTVSFETTMSAATTNCYRLYIGCAGDIGTLNIPANGAIITPEASLNFIGNGGNGTVNITGGTFQTHSSIVDKTLYVGWGVDSIGTINLSSGQFIGGDTKYGWVYLGRRYGTGNFIQTGGTSTVFKIVLAADTTVFGDNKAHGLYEISGGTLRAEGYLLMSDGGEGVLRIIGSSPVVQLERLVMTAGYGHKLEFVLDSAGVSQIDVFGNTSTGSIMQGAELQGEIVMSALPGVTVNVNDHFDVMKSPAYIHTNDIAIKSTIPGIDFVASVIYVAPNKVLRLTAVAATTPKCGDALHPYPVMDFTGSDGNKDCVVNFYDFAMFADTWAEDNNP